MCDEQRRAVKCAEQYRCHCARAARSKIDGENQRKRRLLFYASDESTPAAAPKPVKHASCWCKQKVPGRAAGDEEDIES